MTTASSFAHARKPVVPSVVLATLIFLFTEVMVFCALISSYVVLRSQAGVWPPAGQPRLPVVATAFNSALLLLSGLTISLAIPALVRGRTRYFSRLMQATFVLGAAFVVLQGLEWASLIGFGLTSSSSLYGSLFYTLVGCHGLHVLAALVVLGMVLRRAGRGRYRAEAHDGVTAMRLYWLFVVAIWPPLYGLVYLW